MGKQITKATQVIQTSKENMEQLKSVVQNIRTLQDKKLYVCYKYKIGDYASFNAITMSQNDLWSKPVINATKEEFQIILGVTKAEHDDEVMNELNITQCRSPPKWWQNYIFGDELMERIARRGNEIYSACKNPEFLNAEEEKLPIFSTFDADDFAQTILDRAQKLMQRAIRDTVFAALHAYLYEDRRRIVASSLNGYTTAQGPTKLFSRKQKKILENLYLIITTAAMEKSVSALQAQLKKNICGYAQWCWQHSKQTSTNTYVLSTILETPLKALINYMTRTTREIYYGHIESCIRNIPEQLAEHLQRSAERFEQHSIITAEVKRNNHKSSQLHEVLPQSGTKT